MANGTTTDGYLTTKFQFSELKTNTVMTKKIIIFGATGGIGRHAVRHALEKGYEVVAYVRNPSKIKIEHPKLTVAKGELTDYAAMRDVIRGCDAVVWTVGVSMERHYEGMPALDGHKLLLKAMQETGVKRLVDWGTPSVKFEQDKRSFITIVPGIAAAILFPQSKKEMVAIGDLLKQSDLDWTLVRFMQPTDKEPVGEVKVSFGDKSIRMAITRDDIAKFMIEQVESKEYIKSMPIIGS